MRSNLSKLTPKESKARLKQLKGWKISGGKLKKRFAFKDFAQLMKFVNRLARLAESQNHHPDFCIHYNKLDIEIWTHSANGLTEKDFALAGKIYFS